MHMHSARASKQCHFAPTKYLESPRSSLGRKCWPTQVVLYDIHKITVVVVVVVDVVVVVVVAAAAAVMTLCMLSLFQRRYVVLSTIIII